jgi:hypothetical protein
MSRAEKWTHEARQLEFRERGSDEVFASVSLKGNLIFDEASMTEESSDALWLKPADALRFAVWIIRVFGNSSWIHVLSECPIAKPSERTLLSRSRKLKCGSR